MSPRSGLIVLVAGHASARTSQMAVSFGLAYFIFEETRSAGHMSAAVFARLLPSIVLSLAAGALSDARAPHRTYILASIAMALGSSLLAVLLQRAGTAAAVHVALALLFLLGIVDSFAASSFQKTSFDVIARCPVDRARLHGMTSFAESAPALIAPAVTALLLGHGAWTLALLDAGLWAASGIAFLMVYRTTDLEHVGAARSIRWKDLALGIERIRSSRQLRSLQSLFSAFNFLSGMASGLLGAFVLMTFNGSKEIYAVSMTVLAIGAVVGSTASSAIRVSDARRVATMVAAMLVAAAFGRLLLGLSDGLLLVAMGLAVRGFATPVANSLNQSLWFDHVASHEQGRVFGARRFLSQGPFPLGVLAGGLAVSALDAHPQALAWTPAVHRHGSTLAIVFVAIGMAEVLACVVFQMTSACRARTLTQPAERTSQLK
jgi:MFS transporter, DHA3 family, macrolide efflux protein